MTTVGHYGRLIVVCIQNREDSEQSEFCILTTISRSHTTTPYSTLSSFFCEKTDTHIDRLALARLGLDAAVHVVGRKNNIGY